MENNKEVVVSVQGKDMHQKREYLDFFMNKVNVLTIMLVKDK